MSPLRPTVDHAADLGTSRNGRLIRHNSALALLNSALGRPWRLCCSSFSSPSPAFSQPGEVDLGLFDWQQQLYHSAPILSHDYGEMLDRFRVFVYPLKNSTRGDLRQEMGDPSGGEVDRVFFQSLMSSGFLTDDQAADMFLVPASVWALWKNSGGVARALRSYIQQLRDFYPHWQRTLAADHFFISCRGFESDWSRNVLELQKNAIQVACFPLKGDQAFLPHKDISLPNNPSQNAHQPDLEVEEDDKQRVYLGLYVAADDPIRQSHKNFVALFNESSDTRSLLLRSSRFCISLGIDDRQLIIDGLRSGCVPVIVASGPLSDLPFQDILDWNQFAVVVRRDQLSEIGNVLESTDIDEERLRQNGKLAARHMQWHIPPQPHDAFYMAMYQLWRRHYVVRYIDRTDLTTTR